VTWFLFRRLLFTSEGLAGKLSIKDLKNLSPKEQVKKLLSSGTPPDFSFPSCTSRVSILSTFLVMIASLLQFERIRELVTTKIPTELLAILEAEAVLVQGCWVIKR